MEENISILMADLSGYTALTETHGPFSAADLIDKYIGIVEASLVGDSKLKERSGDEVMIVSASPDNLLSTAVCILKNTSVEENFLQVHGGLHCGKVLKRNNNYFGSTINLAARITSKASPGTFWCSRQFIETLSDKSLFTLHSKGLHRFKNVKEEIEIVEVLNPEAGSFVIDPVCRMLIVDKTVALQHPEKDHLFFCSRACFDIFNNEEAYPVSGKHD
jgi:adenylate cyclase